MGEVEDSVGISNPHLGPIMEGFLEEDVSMLRPLGEKGINQERGRKWKKRQQNQPCDVGQERLACSLSVAHWLHQVSTEWPFPASPPLPATVPDFPSMCSLTNISISESVRFMIYYTEGTG